MKNKLRDIRKAQGLTLHALSVKTNLRLAHISQIELGRVTPKVDTVRKLADALGAAMDDIFPAA